MKIRQERQRRFVLKCGGSTLQQLDDAFFDDLGAAAEHGAMPVIVHGGGPAISELLEKMAIPTEFVGGLRKTSAEVLDVVELVLSGMINKAVVRRFLARGVMAAGLSGVDGRMLEAQPVANAADIGFVGDVTRVRPELIEAVLKLRQVPVIAPLAIDQAGQRYNVNADTAAGAVADALGVQELIVVTDVPGILKRMDGELRPMAVATIAEVEAMIESGEISGGMIPKVRAAMKCLLGAVQEVRIVDGGSPGVLRRWLEGEAVGTRLIR